jgi:carbon starvation protein
MSYWYNFALMFEALFILTTVDTGTRVARFLVQEFGGYIYKPLRCSHWVPGIIITSFLVVAAWSYLIYSGNVSTIWPMFGVANQLLSAIALSVGTTLIIKSGKLKYAWVTFVPMCFMFITTLTAAWQLMFIFRNKAMQATIPVDVFNFNMDAVLVLLMAILALISLIDILYKWYLYRANSYSFNTHK